VARKAKSDTNQTPNAGTAADASPSTGKPFVRRKSSTAAKKRSLKSAPKAKTTRTKPAAAGSRPHPTDEDIRMRAYFISERRHRLALPGDASADWLEAKRQLVAEVGQS
jgi:hypothetical protein